jgi:hypothetical protein
MDKRKRTNTDLQNSTHKTNKRDTRTLLKNGGELRCSRRVGSSCSTSGTRRVNLVTNPVINHGWGKDRKVFTTGEAYPWLFVTQIFHSDQRSHCDNRKTIEVMTSTLDSVASLLAAWYALDQFSLWYLHQRYTGSDIIICSQSFYLYRVDDSALLSWFILFLQNIHFLLLHIRNCCDPFPNRHIVLQFLCQVLILSGHVFVSY